MAQQIVPINNIAPLMKVEEVVIGSQFKLAVRFMRLTDPDPETYAPFDFTGMDMDAHIKDKVKTDVAPDAEFTCTPRVGVGDDEEGWVDFIIDGEVTALLLPKIYHASFKVWPTGEPEHGDTLMIFELPVVYRATR